MVGPNDSVVAQLCRYPVKSMQGERLAGDVKDLVAPRVVAPGHCTGWRTAGAFAQNFSPDSYAPSVVGASYVLNAA